MPNQARTPADHYGESERLLAGAESTGTDLQTVAALTAIGHALLATAPRVARRRDRHQPPQAGHRSTGGSPRRATSHDRPHAAARRPASGQDDGHGLRIS